jgi:signal transduction histidine kinase
MLVVLLSLLFIGGITLATPNFMNQSQILFTVFVAITIAMVLTTILPRFLPQAERLVQHRLGGDRLGYQDVLAGLMKELSAESDIDALLQRVATSLHSQMQLSRVLIFLQDPLMDEYRLLAQDEISRQKCDELTPLAANGPVVRWLAENKDSLVRDEQLRVMPREAWKKLADCLDPLQVAVCIPLLIEENLTGVLCLGEKVNKDMFFVSDLKLLVTLATEVALGIRYRRMEEQIVRNNKLISLGTVAAGVAHEIRNPLSSIRAFAQLLPTRSDDPEFKNDFSKRVLQDVDRITTVIQSMLSFAHPGVVTIDNYDAADLIDGALTLIQPRLRGRHIEVTKHFHNPLTLRVDKQQIIQVLLNLLTNALDALPERGRIRITTGVRSVESHQQQPEQHLGIIEIADNGHGISAAIRKRLFDPFFTTKPEGTGLGLSISQKIAQDHGGFISVSSVEGTGATFQLHLPLSQIGISA